MLEHEARKNRTEKENGPHCKKRMKTAGSNPRGSPQAEVQILKLFKGSFLSQFQQDGHA